ncbi:hypothetical protein [Polyangium aurulentum]|uniref:hypothetical protein n=1 Tax=Polyangium aurulentum TaxID=2567896 RepID=UPI0010AEE3CA|nr:hypothetical protein [Polyangium aurulentum]UQA55706.1 hypothetical protein E8A73_030775 [Polyangium aurulentum]
MRLGALAIGASLLLAGGVVRAEDSETAVETEAAPAARTEVAVATPEARRAQEGIAPLRSPGPASTAQEELAETPAGPGVAKRNAGVGLVVGGAVAAAVGGGLLAANLANENDGSKGNFCSACTSKGWIFPTILLSVGGAMVLTGIPLWIIGQKEQNAAAAVQRAEIRVGPLGGSVRLVF